MARRVAATRVDLENAMLDTSKDWTLKERMEQREEDDGGDGEEEGPEVDVGFRRGPRL